MRILFVSAWFPFPPDNGSRIRAYNLIKALSKRHEVFLVSLLQDDSDPVNAAGQDICTLVSAHRARQFNPGGLKSALGFLSSKPRSFVDVFDSSIRRAVDAALDAVRPDALVASTVGVVDYVPERLSIPSVLEQHNCEYAVLKRSAEGVSGWLRRKRRELGWKKFARWEAAVCRRFDAVTMVSEGDRDLMLQAAPDLSDIHVVPNGVDTDHYRVENRAPDHNCLVYNGALTYGANLDAVRYFASDVYPVLARSMPGIRLVVTGRHEGVDLSGISDCPGIELAGYVPDIRDILRRSAACVVPLREGGGSRLKILEAMAAGVPVVSTGMGAEGIDAAHEQHLLIADTPQELVKAISRVSNDRALRDSLSANARELVELKYSWRNIGADFTRIVETVASAEQKGKQVA